MPFFCNMLAVYRYEACTVVREARQTGTCFSTIYISININIIMKFIDARHNVIRVLVQGLGFRIMSLQVCNEVRTEGSWNGAERSHGLKCVLLLLYDES